MNPYLQAFARARRAQGRDPVPVLALAGGALAGWLVRDDLYGGGFTGSPAAWDALGGLVGRLGLLLGAGLTLGTYDLVIRGPDRAVLDTHPLLPQPWYHSRITESARERLPWLLAALGLLWPLGHAHALAFAAIALVGAWTAGLGVGIGVNLAAPQIALSPSFGPFLDAIRGQNPRLQAALLYAPGTALGIAGFGILAGAAGVARGNPALLSAPFLLGAVALFAGRGSAPSAARLPALLGEIDAAYAAAENPDEARVVYLEWAVRFLPAGLRLHVLRELRHVWRAQRGWATGAWGLALVAGLAVWSGQLWLALGVLAASCAVGLSLVDAPWVAESLAIARTKLSLAKALTVVGVSGPVWLVGVGLLLWRGNLGGSIALLGGLLCLAVLVTRLPRFYIPLAVLIVAGSAALGGLV